jgi:hypothetical protein
MADGEPRVHLRTTTLHRATRATSRHALGLLGSSVEKLGVFNSTPCCGKEDRRDVTLSRSVEGRQAVG